MGKRDSNTKLMEETKENLNSDFFKEYKNLMVDYVEERLELVQLSAVEKTAVLTAKLSFGFMVLSFALFALFFMNILFAIFIGDLVQSRALGFLFVGGFYVFLIVLALLFKKKIERPIMNMVVKQMMSKTSKEQN